MKKYLSLVTFVLVVSAHASFAQRDPLYSQYITNPFVINPAYAGLTNNLALGLSYRDQWSGLTGRPRTINLNGHTAIRYNQMGAGAMVVSDIAGNNTVTEAMAAFSYQINVSTHTALSFGMQAGVVNFSVDNSRLNPYDSSDPLFAANYNEAKPRLGFGMLLKNDRFLVGLSVPRMLKTTSKVEGFSWSAYTQHVYFTGAYLFVLSEHLRLKPSTLVKYVKGAPLSVDFNASLVMHENYQLGLLTRNLTTFGAFGQVRVADKFLFGYVFEMPTSSSVDSSFLTHEVSLGLRLNVLKFHATSVTGF